MKTNLYPKIIHIINAGTIISGIVLWLVYAFIITDRFGPWQVGTFIVLSPIFLILFNAAFLLFAKFFLKRSDVSTKRAIRVGRGYLVALILFVVAFIAYYLYGIFFPPENLLHNDIIPRQPL